MKKFFFVTVLLVFIFCGTNAQAAGAIYTYDSLNRLARAEYGQGLYIEYSYDNAGNITRVKVDKNLLVAVITEFTAASSDDHVLVKWKTGSEPDNAGFHILRSDTEDGEYRQITEFIILARGDPTVGSVYSYADYDVSPGQAYYYKLEDTDIRGRRECHGPVSSETLFPGRIRGDSSSDDDIADNGDMDADRLTDISDVILVLQIIAGMSPPVPENSDTDGDGKTGTEDAVYRLQVISGMRPREK